MTTELSYIFTTFHKELKSFILKKTRNATDTDDILQDAFIRIIKNWDKVNQSDNLRLYLYGIVKNTVYDYFKKKGPIHDSIENVQEFTPEEAQNLNAAVANCCIRPFIDKLPDHYREALHLSELQYLSQKELAEQLGISYSGAKSRVQRGKEKLRGLLLDCCPYKSDIYGNIISNGKSDCGC